MALTTSQGNKRADAKGSDERRLYLSNSELRIAKDDGTSKLTIEGCAYRGSATITDKVGRFIERFSPNAAKDLIDRGGIATDGRDVYLNVGHSQEVIPLARTAAKTLRLFEQNGELRFQADLDLRQTTASDVAVAIENGNLGAGGVSVGMIVLRDSWNSSETERTIHAVDLREISLVPHGAYMGTSVELAQRGIYVAELEDSPRAREHIIAASGHRLNAQDLRATLEELKRSRPHMTTEELRRDWEEMRSQRAARFIAKLRNGGK
jgi:HK97 family phage prohead protease